MEKVKIINKKTKVVKYISEDLLDDYLGTNEFEIFKEKPNIDTKPKKFINNVRK